MNCKKIKGGWRASGIVDGGDGEDTPITVQFRKAHGSLALRKAWLGGEEVDEDDAWIAEGWLEEHEEELLDIIEAGLDED